MSDVLCQVQAPGFANARQLRPRNSIKKEDSLVSSDGEDRLVAARFDAVAEVPTFLTGVNLHVSCGNDEIPPLHASPFFLSHIAHTFCLLCWCKRAGTLLGP